MKIILHLLLTLAASCLFANELRAQEPAPVVLGVIYNLSGQQASLDAPGLKGMELAVERINKEGGIQGRPLKLEVRDGKSDPDRCREAGEQLAALKVSAVAGLNDSDLVLAAARPVVKAGIPFITAGATLPSLPAVLGPSFFMACFDDKAQAKAMAKFALRKMGVGSMLVMANREYAFTNALAEYFITSYRDRSGEVPRRWNFTSSDPLAIAPEVLSCQGQGACRGVYVAGMPDDAAPVIRALRGARYPGPVFSGDGFDTPLLSGLSADECGPGIFFSTHVAYDSPRPEVERFVGEWTKAYGSAPDSGFAALGYDAVGLFAQAARVAGTEPWRVRDAMAAIRSHPGVTGDIGYKVGQRAPRKPVFIMRVDKTGKHLAAEVLP